MADPGDSVQPEITDEESQENNETHTNYAETLIHLAHSVKIQDERKKKKEAELKEKEEAEKKPTEKPAVEPEKIDPITQRNNFFRSYENSFQNKLHAAIGPDRKDLHPHIQNFAKEYIQSRRDALFAKSNPEASVNELLQRFPQLSSLINGAVIARIQDEQAKESAKKYEESLQAFKTQEEFRKTQIVERVALLSSEYAKQLQTAGVTGGEYSRTISAFEKAAQETLGEPIRETVVPGVASTNHLMADIQKKMVPLYGEGYIDHGGAYNKTLGWYAQQRALQQHMTEEQKVTRDELLQQVQQLTKVELQPTVIIRPIPIPQSHFQPAAPTSKQYGVTNKIASVFGRLLGSSARQTVNTAATTAAKSAVLGLSSTAWIVIGIIILILLILVLVVVVNQTSTTSQPYPIVAQNIPTSIPSVSPSISTSPVPLPSGTIASGYGQPGQTWETLVPGYMEKTQLPVKGYFTWFGSPGLMDEVVGNRIRFKQITPCPECIGNLSLMRCGDLDRRVWIQRANGTILGPFRVADCAAKGDVATIVDKKSVNKNTGDIDRWIADLSWETAHYTFGGKSETVVIYDRKPN